MKQVKIYTDGSCLKNPGFGGWAYILSYKHYKKEDFGAQANTTNNQMELRAIIEALRVLKEPCEISIFTDSHLMVQSINEWLKDWIKKDFKGKKNVHLWKEYLNLARIHRIRAYWIKAHSGHLENERCDALARKAALEISRQKDEGY